MNSFFKIRKFYQLKHVERSAKVGKRRESPAEHSWSCLMLADYFLTKIPHSALNRLKVYELLMYHDVVEIEAGDVCISKEEERKNKAQKEKEAAHILKEHLPVELKEKFLALFEEFESGKSKEARFAKAIDALDAEIHELDYKEDWKGWTEDFLRRKKGPLFEEFPELKKAFEEIMIFAKKEGYFNQKQRN